MNPRNVWPAVVLAAVGIVAATVMAIAGVSRETILVTLSLMVTPVLGALLAAQVAQVHGQTAQVVQNTNGNQAKLLDMLDAQGKMLATMTPIRPVVAGEPDPAGDEQRQLAA
jgi:hypothetical protein